MRTPRIVTIALAVALAGMTLAAASAGARPHHTATGAANETAKAGGVFRVEWESSFDFTGGFDPTGEYLGEAFGIYSNLLVRTLVGYNHVAGARRQPARAGSGDQHRVIGKGDKTYTFHAQGRHQVRPAAESRDHVEGRPLGLHAHRHELRQRAVRLLLRRNQGHDGLQGWEVQGHRGHQDPRSEDDQLHADQADGRLSVPARNAGGRPAAPGGLGMLHAAERVRPLRHLLGPVHDRRLGQAECLQLRHHQGGRRHLGLGWREVLDLVRNPAYNPATDSTKARENLPNEFTFTVNSNADDIYARVTRGDIEEEIAGETPSVLRQYTARRSCTRTTATAPGT